MPDASMLLHLVATPAGFAAAAVCVCLALGRMRWGYFAGLVATIAIGAGPLLGLFLEEGLAIPPERDWHLVIGSLFGTCCAVGLVQVRFLQPLIICACAAWVAHSIFPSPDIDQEIQPYRIHWIVAVGTSALFNSYLFSRTAASGASSWCAWVLVAQFAVISLGIALNYATLAFSSIGILTATTMFATVQSALTLWTKPPKSEVNSQTPTISAWTVVAILPVTFAASLLALCFRIYNFGTVAAWLYPPILYLPAIVFSVDQVFLSRQSTGKRAFVATLLTTAISVTVVLVLVLSGSTEDY